jgi:restriction system protein
VGWLHRWRERRRQHRVPWEELEDLLALEPTEFEEAVAAIFRELGFRRVRRTGGAGDLSVDITLRDTGNKLVAVQCKRYRPPKRVGSVEIQQFIGMAKLHHKADTAMYVTTSDYTRSALELAADHDVKLVNGVMLAEMLGNLLGAPGKELLDPRGALKGAGFKPETLALVARQRLAAGSALREASGADCQCQTSDISWAGHRSSDGRPVLVCPYCARVATAEEVHEAMIHGAVAFSSEDVPGLEPLREAARRRARAKTLAEEDVRLGLLFLRDSVIERKREQAARSALKQILGRTPTESEVKALATSPPPDPEGRQVCSECSGEMPWSRRLGAYWCQRCGQAEFQMADRTIRLMIPVVG